MGASGRTVRAIVLAALLAGCGAEPAPSTTPTDAGSPSTGPASVAPATAAASASPSSPPGSPSVVPARSPTRSPVVSPGAPAVAGFVTPIPPDPAAAWTGIRWQRLTAANQLSHVQSVTRWQGGFVATGDLVVNGDTARSKVWVSANGGTWEPLAADVFGSRAVIVGVAAIASRVVALTLQSGRYDDANAPGPSHLSSWSLEGPWQSWTSSDGRTWAAHPGPDFQVPRSMTGYSHPTLLAGAGNDLLALTLDEQPLAFTRDGVAWETASLDAFPGGPVGWKSGSIVAFAPGFVAVGSTGTDNVAIASSDGRTWTSSVLPARCPTGRLAVGPAGLILVGDEGDPHSPTEVWCSSLNGRSWRRLPGYAPLAAASDCRGVCSSGILDGDGERMVAYSADPKHAAWTSLDGRSWQSLAISGSRPTGRIGPHGSPYTTLLAPFGLLFVNHDVGSAWLGTPRT